jgi:hypothetical protein
MIWKVNGAAVMSKGANQIPMEELEGRMRADAHRTMVQSAVDANMNTLRVWGGGMFMPDAWYDACDELGVMVSGIQVNKANEIHTITNLCLSLSTHGSYLPGVSRHAVRAVGALAEEYDLPGRRTPPSSAPFVPPSFDRDV